MRWLAYLLLAWLAMRLWKEVFREELRWNAW